MLTETQMINYIAIRNNPRWKDALNKCGRSLPKRVFVALVRAKRYHDGCFEVFEVFARATVADLICLTNESTLRKIPGIGPKALLEIDVVRSRIRKLLEKIYN